MRCALTSRATFYALLSLLAVIAVIQVPLPIERLTMSDDDHAPDLDQRIENLHKWFTTTDRDALVTVDEMQAFLNEMAEIHFMPPAAEDGRANAVLSAGYTSKHAVAQLTANELVGLGFLPGNAKTIAAYLGSPVGPRRPQQLSAPQNNSAAVSAQHSAQLGAAVAAAVTNASTKVTLFNASSSRPTVSAAMKWAKKHLEKVNLSGLSLTRAVQMLLDDATMDVEPHILAEPSRSSDNFYVREVLASLTPDQFDKFGGAEVTSALKLMQKVVLSVADYKMDPYIAHVSAFNAYEGTVDANSVKARLQHFMGLLTEVRYHKMFELKKAMSKLTAVIAPRSFLANEVYNMWAASPKDQASLTKILKYVTDELDVPMLTPEQPQKKHDKKEKKYDGKDKWRGKPWHRNDGKGSGKSQSNGGRRDGGHQPWRKRVNFEERRRDSPSHKSSESRAQVDYRSRILNPDRAACNEMED